MSAAKLILASRSKARISMLQKAGYIFEISPADLDEDGIRSNLNGAPPQEIALALAKEKARCVSENNPNAFVIGSDQICAAGEEIFSKANSQAEAAAKLKSLQGRRHELYSAAAVYQDGKEIWSLCDQVTMGMKTLSDEDIHTYLQKAGEVATSCAGAYAIEEIGVRLFKYIDGDYFSILGMPLLPLIRALDEQGFEL